MNKLKLCFLIEALIVLALIIILPFTQNNNFGNNELITYITAKVVFGLAFIITVIYACTTNYKTGNNTVLVTVSTLVQLIPLGIRYILLGSSEQKYLFSILLIAIPVIIYVGLLFGLNVQSKKMDDREKISEVKDIEIKEEKVVLEKKENN